MVSGDTTGERGDYALHYYPSPNSLKVIILLNELALPWRDHWVDLAAGEQLTPEFAALNPNRKVPVLQCPSGETVFESGAILEFLAERHSSFLGASSLQRWRVKQWLYWQMAALGPAAGQAHHFRRFAPEQVPYAIRRFTDEVNRLYGILDEVLQRRAWLADDYSIADMAVWPWVVHADWQGQSLGEFPGLARWFADLGARPAVAAAMADYPTRQIASKDYAILLNQTAADLRSPPAE